MLVLCIGRAENEPALDLLAKAAKSKDGTEGVRRTGRAAVGAVTDLEAGRSASLTIPNIWACDPGPRESLDRGVCADKLTNRGGDWLRLGATVGTPLLCILSSARDELSFRIATRCALGSTPKFDGPWLLLRRKVSTCVCGEADRGAAAGVPSANTDERNSTLGEAQLLLRWAAVGGAAAAAGSD